MKNKIAFITGATSGIGKATAHGLAAQGYTVVLHARNHAKGDPVLAELKAATGNENIDLLTADLGSQLEIHEMAKQFKAKYSSLHLLINNAGAIFNGYGETRDRIERTLAVNHLAPFLLTHLLLDLLKASAPARIVNVASGSHYSGSIRFSDLGHKNGYHGMKVYGQSKLANVLFTYELARRLEGTGITVNALHPGVVKTQIGNKSGGIGFSMIWSLMKPFMITADKGAKTSLHVATSPELEGVTGKYFENSKEKKSSEASHDQKIAERLWEASAKLTNMKLPEPAAQ